MRRLYAIWDRVDVRLHRWLVRHSITLLRVTLGAIFLGFGVLKFFPGISPAAALAEQTFGILTFGLVPAAVARVLTAILECVIGLCFITGKGLRAGVWLLGVQLLGALSPLLLLAGEMFSGPPSRTLAGGSVRDQERGAGRRGDGDRRNGTRGATGRWDEGATACRAGDLASCSGSGQSGDADPRPGPREAGGDGELTDWHCGAMGSNRLPPPAVWSSGIADDEGCGRQRTRPTSSTALWIDRPLRIVFRTVVRVRAIKANEPDTGDAFGGTHGGGTSPFRNKGEKHGASIDPTTGRCAVTDRPTRSRPPRTGVWAIPAHAADIRRPLRSGGRCDRRG